MISLQLNNVTKTFKTPGGGITTAVNSLDLSIESGKFVTLLGPSGCGKTTTLRMIAGFEVPDSGQILIDNKDVTYLPPNERGLAMVFQSYALFPHLTVAENIAYGLKIRKIAAAEIKQRVDNVLELVDLVGMGERFPNQLSGGQQQRVALARAIILRPKVLLFDEPLSNLDAKLREDMRERIRNLQQQLKITAVYVTHDQIEAMTMSDVIVVINKGMVEQIGDPFEIYERPVSKFVADFIGRVNLLEANLVKAGKDELLLDLYGNEITVTSFAKTAQRMLLVVRPEKVKLLTDGETNDPFIEGKISKKVYVGQHIEYTIKLDSGVEIFVIALGQKGTFEVGDSVRVGLKMDALHAVPA
jgi:iron(III) transport system ATP-binding protein